MFRRGTPILLVLGLTATLATSGCGEGGSDGSPEVTPIPQPTRAQFVAAGLGRLPVAPDSARVDLTAPSFSDPTAVTNPLFPISDLHSAVLAGTVDDKPFHTETTLLPYTRIIEWAPDQEVEALVSQYVAFLDGRIQEVALDYYAQADDGSVWYLGEDVADYNRRGLIAFTTDSWLAGLDGPPALIMPADPAVGEAFRTENIPGVVFEEVTVKTIDRTVAGPAGPVNGAMVGEELHDDGMRSDKVFAPGYGEFLTRDPDGVEAMALAIPTDALDGPPPPPLRTLVRGAERAFDAVASQDWPTAEVAARPLEVAWRSYERTGEAPPRLRPPIDRALAELSRKVGARDPQGAGTASIDVAQAALDLELRYRPPDEVDLARFDLWARQLTIDADAGDRGAASGDIVTLEWTRDRFADTLPATQRTRLDSLLLAIHEDVVDGKLASAEAGAERLSRVAGSPWR